MTLSLSDYKRPPKDNGRGIHGSGTTGWSGADRGLDYWISELEALGVKWFKVIDANSDSLPFCKKLVGAGIFPVVRILRRDPPPNDLPEPNPGHLNEAEEETIKKLIDVGVLYFETNNEPDLDIQWKNAAIPTDLDEAARLVALNWLFDARFILEAGGYPGLPAISAGRNMDIIGALHTLGRQDILAQGCWIAIHNYGLDRPLDYPADAVQQIGAPLPPNQYDFGPLTNWVWWNLRERRADTLDEVNQVRAAGKKVGSNIFQDHACFKEHEYYSALAQKYLGRPLPILSTEGGYSVGRRDDPRYPRITPQIQADMTVAMFDFMQRDAPEYYFACMPMLMLSSSGSDPKAWYGDFWRRAFQTGPGTDPTLPPFPVPDVQAGANLPVVASVKAMANLSRNVRQPKPRLSTSVAVKPPPPPPPPHAESVYLVRPGETLQGIAEKFGVAVSSLMDLNRTADPGRILPGQRLVIPAGSAAFPASAPPRKVTTAARPLPHLSSPPTPPKPRGWDQFDPRLAALNVRALNAMVPAGYPFWNLVRAEYQDPDQASGHHYVSYLVLDEDSKPIAGQRVYQGVYQGMAEERTETRTDAFGTAKMLISASYSPEHGETGPYSAWVDGLPSDRVTGLGLPVNRQVNFRLTWQRSTR